jgi:ubiquinone biosynthesis protein
MFQDVHNATRLAHAAAVLARHDVLWPRELGPPPHWLGLAGRVARAYPDRAARLTKNEPPAERFAAALERLGPPYIKFGQLLATRPDIVGPALASELAKLQDRLPPFSQAEARAAIENEFGAPVESLFSTLGPPMAAASIAQVHKAETANLMGHNRARETDAPTRAVAVKVLRPNVEAAFARDLASFFWAARLIERVSVPTRRLAPVALVKTLAESVALELDLRLEGAAAAEMAENTKHDSDFRVPRVDWARTGRRVLTMEWVDGISVGDREALMRAGHDTARLATLVTQSFLTHALRDGFFHADMHQGNLFVDAEGRLVAVDFGIMGRLDPASRRYLAEILFGFLTRDYRRIAEVHFEAGYVPERHARESFAQALRAIGEPIFGRSAGDISMARLLAQLFETTALFDMALRPELVLLQKTMVVVEGVARKLDPEHNLWESARPVLERWMAHELSPEARLHSAAEGAASLGRVIAGLPTFLRTVEGAAATYAAHGLKLDAETIAAIGRAEAGHGRRQRLALWIIAAALVALVLLLL